jgi:hypothetical protein
MPQRCCVAIKQAQVGPLHTDIARFLFVQEILLDLGVDAPYVRVVVSPYPGSSSETVLRRAGRNRSYQARRGRRPAKISVLSCQKYTTDEPLTPPVQSFFVPDQMNRTEPVPNRVSPRRWKPVFTGLPIRATLFHRILSVRPALFFLFFFAKIESLKS